MKESEPIGLYLFNNTSVDKILRGNTQVYGEYIQLSGGIRIPVILDSSMKDGEVWFEIKDASGLRVRQRLVSDD